LSGVYQARQEYGARLREDAGLSKQREAATAIIARIIEDILTWERTEQ
jgi:hypothetical protein